MSRRSSVLVALGALVLVVALAPFVPRGGGDDGALRPSGTRFAPAPAETAGFGALTPALRREVDRVVDEGEVLSARLAPASTSQLTAKEQRYGRDQLVSARVQALVRCADFEGQRYCLGSGWTEDTQAQVQARTTVAARESYDRGSGVEATGDLDAADDLAQRAAMTVAQRARSERAELTMAARSVAKVWLLRHEIEGVPLPTGFLADHPEARVQVPEGVSARQALPTSTPTPTVPAPPPPTSTVPVNPITALPTPTAQPTTAPVKTYDQYPESAAILNTTQVADQQLTYWCGPTSMQMIAWGWKNKYRSQQHWADQLGTTSSGSSISSMVAVTNKRTGWDGPSFAGPYVALDIQQFSFDQWQLLLMKHIVDFHAPLILHVELEKQFFPYLDHDGSGHFQVGRGYDKHGNRPDLIGYFEPWNQQRFHPDEPFINRVQWRQSYRTYRATLAHYQHDVGV